MKKIIVLGFVFGLTPLLTLAAPDGTITGVLGLLIYWVGLIVPVLVTIAIGYFIWGVISFITASDEEAKKMGKTKIVNGLIGLFVILAFWGIIAMVRNTFGVNGGADYRSSVTEGMPILK